MIISVSDIGKRYDAPWIFRHFTHSFEAPSVSAIVGANGSGKSTLIQILSGFVTPSEGRVEFSLHGRAVPADEVFTYVSMASPGMELMEDLSVLECATIHVKLKKMRLSMNALDVLNACDLIDHKEKPLTKLSSGMKQRLKLALAILSDTNILLLDEPCSNLDAQWAAWFTDTLRMHAANRLVIISSNSQKNELELVNSSVIDMGTLRV